MSNDNICSAVACLDTKGGLAVSDGKSLRLVSVVVSMATQVGGTTVVLVEEVPSIVACNGVDSSVTPRSCAC